MLYNFKFYLREKIVLYIFLNMRRQRHHINQHYLPSVQTYRSYPSF